MIHPRECLYCGKRFIGKTNRANFCCDSHRQMYYRNGKNPRKGVTPVTNPVIPPEPKKVPKGKITSCLNCGTDFKKKRSTNNFCTPSCRVIYNNAKKTGVKKISLTPLSFTCDYCGDYFETYRHSDRFCCTSHRDLFSRGGYTSASVIKEQTFDDVIFDDEITNRKVIYANCEFIDCNFESTKWHQSRFVNCVFTDCFFQHVELYGTKFLDCGFYGTNDFTNAIVKRITIKPEPNPDNFIRDGWIT